MVVVSGAGRLKPIDPDIGFQHWILFCKDPPPSLPKFQKSDAEP